MGAHPVHAALTTDYVKQLLRIKARQLIRRRGFRAFEQEDLAQDLVAHILKQAHHFDSSRASVNTFIARVVDSAVAMILRHRRRLKRAAGFHAASLEGTRLGGGDGETPLTEIIHEADLLRRTGGRPQDDLGRAETASDLSQVLTSLSPPHREIAWRLTDATEAAIARDLAISRRQVRKAVAAIRKRLEEAGFGGI